MLTGRVRREHVEEHSRRMERNPSPQWAGIPLTGLVVLRAEVRKREGRLASKWVLSNRRVYYFLQDCFCSSSIGPGLVVRE